MNARKHWENVFATKDMSKVSWSQQGKSLSFEIITKYAQKDDNIIDIGCGASFLADTLLQHGFGHITLLDISQTALDMMQQRLDDKVQYICSDITNFTSSMKFDIWHDRAVLHFLTTPEAQQQYQQILSKTLRTGGVAIIATFAPDKVRKCSDLATCAYDTPAIQQLFGDVFDIKECINEEHHTPSGEVQLFNYFVLQKR